jgi:[pyruvate, water dikinase]-phosphate phosphotransferase / [pyruvate, water dikinase] kinase
VLRPIVFSTLVKDDCARRQASNGLFLDFFDAFLGPLEAGADGQVSRARRVARTASPTRSYTARASRRRTSRSPPTTARDADYERADVILVGVSRSGKTPTCIYMAMQYGVFAANYPFTEDDFEASSCRRPSRHAAKLFGLTISPERLQQIRNERGRAAATPPCRNASSKSAAPRTSSSARHALSIDTTECSIEEIASRIIDRKGIERRLRP